MKDKRLEREIELLRKENHEGGDDDSPSAAKYADIIVDCLEEVMEVIERQNHSGMSISFLSQYISRACKGLPLTSLKGSEDEWVAWEKYGEGPKTRQNLRYYSLFQKEDGTLSDTNRAVFITERDGITWHAHIPEEIKAKIPPIKFPYFPIHGEYKIYGNDFYFDEDGNDRTEEHRGMFNRTFYHYMEDGEGNRAELNLWYEEGEDGKWKRMESRPATKRCDVKC